MNIKIILVFVVLVLVTSCSSSAKKPEISKEKDVSESAVISNDDENQDEVEVPPTEKKTEDLNDTANQEEETKIMSLLEDIQMQIPDQNLLVGEIDKSLGTYFNNKRYERYRFDVYNDINGATYKVQLTSDFKFKSIDMEDLNYDLDKQEHKEILVSWLESFMDFASVALEIEPVEADVHLESIKKNVSSETHYSYDSPNSLDSDNESLYSVDFSPSFSAFSGSISMGKPKIAETEFED